MILFAFLIEVALTANISPGVYFYNWQANEHFVFDPLNNHNYGLDTGAQNIAYLGQRGTSSTNQDRVYFFGQLAPPGSPMFYDTDHGEFQSIPSLAPFQYQYNPAVGSLQDNIIACGGQDMSSKAGNPGDVVKSIANVCQMFSYTTQTWSVLAPTSLPIYRNEAAMVELSGTLYQIGGTLSNQIVDSQNCFYLTPDGQWHQCSNPPIGVNMPGLLALNNTHILMCGGFQGVNGDPTSKCYTYNTQSDIWMPSSSLLTPRAYFLLVDYRGVKYAIGGQTTGYQRGGQAGLLTSIEYENEKGVWCFSPLALMSGGGLSGGVLAQ